MIQAIADRLATILPDTAVSVNGDRIAIGNLEVVCTMTGNVRLVGKNFGAVTVSTMSDGPLTIAHNVATAYIYAG